MLHHTHMSVIIPEPRLFRIRALQRAYSALQKDLPYLEERIYLLRAVVSDLAIQHRSPRRSTHVDVSSLARHRYDLGTALYDRYLHILELVDLEEAEACLRLTLRDDSLTLSFPNPSCLLGSVLREYAHRSKDTRLTEEALSLHRKPFESHAYPHISVLEHAHRSRELGLTLLSYEYIKFEEDILSESIRHLQAAQAAFTDMQVPDHTSCIGLSIALVYLCYIQLDRTRMDNGVKYGTLAIALCGSAHRDFYRATQALGSARSFFFFSFDDLESLNCAIDLYQAALGSDPPPRWAQLLIFGLTQNLNGRSIRLGRTDDLLEAITHITALLAMLGPEDERWASLQESLALSFHTKFKFTGMQEDIEAAARAANSAYCAAGPGTEVVDEKAYRLSVIASCRGEQYAAFGDIAHLNECVELLEHVMEMAVVHSSHWMYAAANLLEAYHLRYKATEDVRDLDRAIALLPPLKKTTQDRATNAPNELFRAGDAFLSRFLVTGTLDDLEQATMLHQEAAAYDSAHHNHETRNAYATTLRTRYEVLHEEESAAKALEMQKKAIAALSEMHPDRPSLECGLARIRLCVDPTPTHVSEAFDHVLGALNSDYCPAYKRLKSVLEVLAYLSTHMPILGCENALKLSVVYSTSIDLLPQVASFGLEPRARLAVMTGAGQFTIQGAVHAISIGQLDQALEMLEAGRSVFWTQGLRLRTPFTDLPRVIGDRLTKITYALSRPPLEGSDKDHELSRRRKLGNEFQAVLAEARLEPGFEDLLKNVSFEALARAASHHPVLVLVAGDASGHAIIVSENAQCMLVGLPRATNKALRALATRVEARIKTVRSLRGIRRVQATDAQPHDVYKQLWTLVMRPIVEALRWPIAKGRDRRRLTLCPTGVFMQLPLHAAGTYLGNERVSCSDYFVASYTPSISALLHAQQTAEPVRRSEAETLLVAVQNPFRGVPLPMVDKEANVVREHVSMSSKVTQVSACDDVLRQIHSASVLHLACHGTQNPSDALQSGFYLEDELLSVSKLMELDLPRAFLAVLSACETAKGDATQPDQAIHLAAAMLFTGFKSVIATMWFMGDLEGPVVAESVYMTLFKGGNPSEHLDPDDVPYALDDAVRKMRESGLDPSFWATYVHIGI